VAVNTNSPDMVVSPGAIQPTFAGGPIDGFVARIRFAHR
jgi:hypothetical protein